MDFIIDICARPTNPFRLLNRAFTRPWVRISPWMTLSISLCVGTSASFILVLAIIAHPLGYGFLSENPEFARKVEEAGIAFAGPPSEVIEECGDKTKARNLAIRVGVPVVPGSDGPVQTLAQATAFIQKYGLPVIIKAAMGGGGRGMRVVRDAESLASLFERAVSEAKSAFGDGTVFLERFIERPRHIEVQLLADGVGNVIHLYERDCSVQRRYQKVVEMAPALQLPVCCFFITSVVERPRQYSRGCHQTRQSSQISFCRHRRVSRGSTKSILLYRNQSAYPSRTYRY